MAFNLWEKADALGARDASDVQVATFFMWIWEVAPMAQFFIHDTAVFLLALC